MFKHLLFFISFLPLFKLQSQSLANYGSVRNTGISYSSISATGNSFASWRNTTSATTDDNRSEFTNIGFDFWYNGIRYTQFCVSTNGFVDFASSTDDGGPLADDFGYSNAAFTSSNLNNSTNPAITPFYDDLKTQGTSDPMGTSIKYALSGSAPNRTLTIEWINLAASTNTTPSLNFQVEIMEGTGIIKTNYGVMTNGTQLFSYSMGLNSSTISAVPTAAQLKMLQVANGNSFSNGVQNNLSTIPASNSQYVFTPPVPTAVAGSLTFSTITQTSMTLNWTNWATNEAGYVVYNSTDGANFNFVTQTAANAVSVAVTGLLPSTSYFWRLYAVTEGCLSSALTGTQATTAAGNKVSNGSGNWLSATTWSPNGVPTAADNVTIGNGHVIQLNATTAQCNNLTVGGGASGRLEYNNGGTNTSFTVNGNITINTGATLWIPNNSNATSSITIMGNVVNNGTLNLASDWNSIVQASFLKNGSQTISGTGATTQFQNIVVNLGSAASNTLDIAIPSFSATLDFLTLINGTFKLSASNTATVTPFTNSVTIGRNSGLYLNAPNMTFSTGASVNLFGKLSLLGGTLNIGNAANEDLALRGSTVNISGGALNVPGKLYTQANDISNFSMSGGTITVASLGSTNTANAPFQITGAASTFSMSDGAIVIVREGGSGAQDLGFINTASLGSVTGGTLQLGNATTPAAQTLNVNSFHPVGNFIINSANVTAKLITNSLTVISNVTMLGSLFSNSLNISLGGNWTANGGTYTPGSNIVTFSSTAAQSIFKSGIENFNHLSFIGAGLKTFSCSAIATGNFSINTGSGVDVSALNSSLTVAGNFLTDGTFNARAGQVFLNGTTAQTIGGSSSNTFHDLMLNNNAGATLTSPANLIGSLTLNNGTFNLNGQAFTMVSTATATARIAQITGSGDITGNVIVQRFAPGGTTGWALFGTPISSALTLNEWDDDIYISCPTCPDGQAGSFLSIYTYDESVNGTFDNPLAYYPLNTINDPIIPGIGYWVYLGDGLLNTNPITIDVTGNVRKFNYTIPLTYNNYGSAIDDGWNLLHNPYPSPISWAALMGATPGIDNAVYAYNADLNGGSGAHATYVNFVSSPAVGSGGIGDAIPMSQGFYVHSTGATALNATEAIKVGGNPTYLKTNAPPASPSSLVRFFLDGPYNFHDETVLYLQAGATNNFDPAYDAYKLPGQDPYAPAISLLNAGRKYQVNGVPPIVASFTSNLNTLTGYAGSYTISASNFSTFPAGACVTLHDKFLLTNTDLKTSNYSFYLSDTTTVARFMLIVTVNPLLVNSTITQPSCQQPLNGAITAVGASSGPWNYYWKDQSGNPVKTSLNKTTADTLTGLTSGTYSLEVNTIGQCDNNNSNFYIDPVIISVAQFTSVDTLYNLSQNSLVNFNNTSINTTSQQWNFGDNLGYSPLLSPSYNYGSVGIYTVSLVSISSTGCNDTAFKKIVVLDNDVSIHSISGDEGLIIKTLSNNEFLIEQKLPGTSNVSFKIHDALGKLVINYGSSTTNNIRQSISLKNYSPGIYYLKMTIDEQEKVIKLPVKD